MPMLSCRVSLTLVGHAPAVMHLDTTQQFSFIRTPLSFAIVAAWVCRPLQVRQTGVQDEKKTRDRTKGGLDRPHEQLESFPMETWTRLRHVLRGSVYDAYYDMERRALFEVVLANDDRAIRVGEFGVQRKGALS